MENPLKTDWTVEVRKNLEEFGITTNLENIKTMSKYSYKKLVMKNAREFEFNRFLQIKETKCKSKMKTCSTQV